MRKEAAQVSVAKHSRGVHAYPGVTRYALHRSVVARKVVRFVVPLEGGQDRGMRAGEPPA